MSNVRFDGDLEEITEWRRMGLTWMDIAQLVQRSTETLLQWRRRVDYRDPGTPYDEATVDGLVLAYLDGNPLRGQRLVLAHLRNVCGIRLTRDQMRDSVARVDPGGLEGRRCQMLRRLVRRAYVKMGPHYCW